MPDASASCDKCYLDHCLLEIISRYKETQRLVSQIHEQCQSLQGKENAEGSAIGIYEKILESEAIASGQIKLLQEMSSVMDDELSKEKERAKRQKLESYRRQGTLFAPATPGTLVAMKRDYDADEWMLASVISFDPITLKYVVEDVEDDDEEMTLMRAASQTPSRKRYVVPPQQVRPLPDSDAAAVKLHEFPVSHIVLALFPATTCLYRAVVVGAPSRRKKTFDYLVHFDNDEIDGVVPSRIVNARFVLDFVMEPVHL